MWQYMNKTPWKWLPQPQPIFNDYSQHLYCYFMSLNLPTGLLLVSQFTQTMTTIIHTDASKFGVTLLCDLKACIL